MTGNNIHYASMNDRRHSRFIPTIEASGIEQALSSKTNVSSYEKQTSGDRNRMPNWISWIVVTISIFAYFPASATTQTAGSEISIAVIVNNKNKKKELSLNIIKNIFFKRQTHWGPDSSSIIVLNQQPRSVCRKKFERLALEKDSQEMVDYWIERRIRGQGVPPPSISSDLMVVRIVSRQESAVGYICGRPDALRKKLHEDTQIVRIDGKLPGDPGYKLK